MEHLLRTVSADETRAVGAALAPLLRLGDVVVLTGDLGAGKTTFVQGVAAGLGADEHVASPTFTLVREYVTGRIPVAHVDVFRLDRIQDVVDLGLDELVDGACVLLVEWGDVIDDLLSQERLRVELTSEEASDGTEVRRLSFTGSGSAWLERSDELAAATSRWSVSP